MGNFMHTMAKELNIVYLVGARISNNKYSSVIKHL